MKYLEVCPQCGGNPETDEDGNYYTCFYCGDAGAIEVEETYEETISRKLNEAYSEYADDVCGPVTHRFIFEDEVFEVRGFPTNPFYTFRDANIHFNPTQYGAGSWVANEKSDIFEYHWYVDCSNDY